MEKKFGKKLFRKKIISTPDPALGGFFCEVRGSGGLLRRSAERSEETGDR